MTNQIKININGSEFHSDEMSIQDIEARVKHLQDAPRFALEWYENKKPNQIDLVCGGDTEESIALKVEHYKSEMQFYENVLRQIDFEKDKEEN